MKSKTTVVSSDYAPKRFGLRFGPTPAIVLEYLVPSTGKLYHHKMKLKNLSTDVKPDIIISELMRKHELYLNHPRLHSSQLVKLINKLLSVQAKEAPKTKEVKEDIDYNKVDLNKLSDKELELHKKKMDEMYYKNYHDPKSKEFVYDIEQDFEADEQVDESWDN